PPHVAHRSIREEGCGRYSRWGDTVYFSTSDNSDPRSNGRLYHAYIAGEAGESAAASRAMCAVQRLPAAYTRSEAYAAIETALKELDPKAVLGDPHKAYWGSDA